MRVQILVGVFYEGRPLMPPEMHDLPADVARAFIHDGRAVLAPDEIQTSEPLVTNRDPAPARGVRRH
jgi:hypothetical protein